MADFPYTTVPGKISDFLEKIRTVGVPEKATNQWLKSVGFTSSNDTTLVPVFKFIDFCTQTGNPTDRWRSFRGHESKAVLGLAIQHGYSDLFAVYPDANTRSDEELTSFFNTRSNAGAQAIGKTVSTFKTLCREAEFGIVPAAHATGATPSISATNSPLSVTSSGFEGGPEVHIDIQIHISSEASAEQIDQMFASMAKHLYGRDS
ncbi:MAG: DUF5343 domain-containing protein [Rubinisphaera brasiliensis]|uniref:DUF5343 domain-containing protein n=1 Tax=Rubinisphaera brasiliensis TaxID=119 RepID=UPI00391A5224